MAFELVSFTSECIFLVKEVTQDSFPISSSSLKKPNNPLKLFWYIKAENIIAVPNNVFIIPTTINFKNVLSNILSSLFFKLFPPNLPSLGTLYTFSQKSTTYGQKNFS